MILPWSFNLHLTSLGEVDHLFSSLRAIFISLLFCELSVHQPQRTCLWDVVRFKEDNEKCSSYILHFNLLSLEIDFLKIFYFAGTKCISVLLWVEETALTRLQDCFLGYICLEKGNHCVLSSVYPSLLKSCHLVILLAKLMDMMDILTSFKVSKLSPMWSLRIFSLVEKRIPSLQPMDQ